MRELFPSLPSLAAAVVALIPVISVPLRADLTEFDIDRNVSYSQTSRSLTA